MLVLVLVRVLVLVLVQVLVLVLVLVIEVGPRRNFRDPGPKLYQLNNEREREGGRGGGRVMVVDYDI